MSRYDFKRANVVLLILCCRRRGVLSKTPSTKTAPRGPEQDPVNKNCSGTGEGTKNLFNKIIKIAQPLPFHSRAVFDNGVMPRTPDRQFLIDGVVPRTPNS